MTEAYQQQFEVPFGYPVFFARNLFRADNSTLARLLDADESGGRRALVFLDDGVAAGHPDLRDRVSAWFSAQGDRVELVRAPMIVPGGEAIKNDYRRTMEIVDLILEYRLCRHSYVIAIGGGAFEARADGRLPFW